MKKATGGIRVVLGDPWGLGEIFGSSFGLDLLGGKNCLCLEMGEFWADEVRGAEGDGALLAIRGSSSGSEIVNDPAGGSTLKF